MTAFNANHDSLAFPRTFSTAPATGAVDLFLDDPSTRKLVEFFEAKGLAALKQEDREERWYDDWLTYQAKHRIYASVLSPKAFSSLGGKLDLARLARFVEVFAYFSPAHGYSFQCTLLGLFSVLIGANADLKREAVAAMESGGLLAFGVSEEAHGSDLLGNEFVVRDAAPGRLRASGKKFYIGNADRAAIISILARKADAGDTKLRRRSPFVLFALRPGQTTAIQNATRIRTLGIRSAYVAQFEMKDHELPRADVIAEGRDAWDAIFGSIVLGKFVLGFASIGMCEHAMSEAVAHLRGRVLFGKPVIAMPHIRALVAQAYARLMGMKLFAYRALDYLYTAGESDRRYLFFNAVQKAQVSTEGVKVMASLLECIGAKAFESDTYFEMALRDIQLIPRLEGSTHINLGLAAQFAGEYFRGADDAAADPPSRARGENAYLFSAKSTASHRVRFRSCLGAYEPLKAIPNVGLFVSQVEAFAEFFNTSDRAAPADATIALAIGQGVATIAYAQLIAEAAASAQLPPTIVSSIFHLLVLDLGSFALALAAAADSSSTDRALLQRMAVPPQTSPADWDTVVERAAAL
jgi:acyl-CoA dehydrogenase